jgi:hypothetical protein
VQVIDEIRVVDEVPNRIVDVGLRPERQHPGGGWIETRRGDDVPGKRLPRQRVADDRRERAEVALSLGIGRHRCGQRHALDEVGPFVRSEEERPVSPERSAERPAVLLAVERRLRGCEVVARVQRVISEKREAVSVITRAAGFRDQADDATDRESVLRAVAGAEDLEFLDGVGRRERHDLARGLVVVVEAVEQVVVVVDARAVDVEAAAAVRER